MTMKAVVATNNPMKVIKEKNRHSVAVFFAVVERVM